jgi:hypothetical protein
MPADTHTVWRPEAATPRFTASTAALPPSYSEALATGSPANRATMVWYSKMACSTPWATSGWYGV